MNVRWRVVTAEISLQRGRLGMMLVAMLVGVVVLTAMASAYAILSRELDGAYLATRPATASLEVRGLDDATLSAVRALPGVAWAEAHGRVWARMRVGPGWLPILLFVRADFAAPRMNVVTLERGAWPAPVAGGSPAGMVIERSAVMLAQAVVGAEVEIKGPSGVIRQFVVSGVAHDPALPPAAQQQVIYAFVTPAALSALQLAPQPSHLGLTVSGPPADVDTAVLGVAKWLQQTGHAVGEIRIPPRHHPHWGMMQNIIRLLLALSAMTLVLGAVLTGTLTAALLAGQARTIGVMKAIGAGDAQIGNLYATLVAGLGAAAVFVGLPLGLVAGRALAARVAHNQNLDVSHLSVPVGLLLALAVLGVGVPLLLALIPIRRATRRTVRECLEGSAYGSGASRAVARVRLARWLGLVGWRGPLRWPFATLATLAMRNALRRRGHLWLTLAVLAPAGALFISSLNMLASYRHTLESARTERPVDLTVEFIAPQSVAGVLAVVRAQASVLRVESFDETAAAVSRDDGLLVTHTFPDGGHGRLRLQAVAVDTAFVNPVLLSGGWLTRSAGEAVLNSDALSRFPGVRVGDALSLRVRGREVALRVRGIVSEHLAGATVYVASSTYAAAVGEVGVTGGLRIGLRPGHAAASTAAAAGAAAVEAALTRAGYPVAGMTTRSQEDRALSGHLYMLLAILMAMSLALALVGILALGATLGAGVVERTREIGVMRAIGAGDGSLRATVLFEGLFIASLSVAVAAVCAVPLSWWLARVTGSAGLGEARASVVSGAAVPVWLGVVLAAAALACVAPAQRAMRVTVRDALA